MESHLLQMRGLKQLALWLIAPLNPVASFTDAWIETIACQLVSILETVASFTDAWIETGKIFYMPIDSWGRIFYRCVD